jgi:PAS domain S-box-containing protein
MRVHVNLKPTPKISLFAVIVLLLMTLGTASVVSWAAYRTHLGVLREARLQTNLQLVAAMANTLDLLAGNGRRDAAQPRKLRSLWERVGVDDIDTVFTLITADGKLDQRAISKDLVYARGIWEGQLKDLDGVPADFSYLRQLGDQARGIFRDVRGDVYLAAVAYLPAVNLRGIVFTPVTSLHFEAVNRTLPWGISSLLGALSFFAMILLMQRAAYGRGREAGFRLRRPPAEWRAPDIKRPQAAPTAIHAAPEVVRTLKLTLSTEGVILKLNSVASEVLGYEENEVLGRLFVSMVMEEDQELIRRSFRAIAEEQGMRREFRVVARDGSVVWLRELMRHDEKFEGQVVVGLECDNITDQKYTSAKLRDVQAKLQLITTHISSIIWITDADLRIIDSLGASGEQLGRKPDEFVGKSLYELFESQDGSVVAIAAHLRALRGEPAEYELEINGADFDVAVEPFFDPNGRVIGSIALAQDVTDRRRTERALRESEHRFRDVAEASSDWIWEMDKSFRLTYLSERFREVTKLPPESVLGLTVWEIGDTEADKEKWARHRERLEQRLPFRDFVYRVKAAKARGRKLYFKVSGRPVYDSAGNFVGYRGTGSDITAQVEAEARAATAERRLAEAMESISEGLALWDSNDRLVFCNSQYRNLYPASAEQVKIGARFRDLVEINLKHSVYADVGPDREKWLAEYIEAHRSPGAPFIQRLSDGRHILVSERRTRDGGIIGIRTDITALKRREDALTDSETRTRVILDAAVDGIITIDEQGRMESFNAAAKRIFGYSGREMMNNNMSMLMSANQAQRFAEFVKRHIEAGQDHASSSEEFTGRRRDNSEFPMLVSVAGMRLGDRVVLTVIVHDVTARKRAEAALRDTENATRTLYKVASAQNRATEDKIQLLLNLGCERYNATFGALTRVIDGDRQQIVAARSPDGVLEPGIVLPLAQTYCSKTVESEYVIAIEHASKSEWGVHPAFVASHWESYIGTRVMVRGEVYGTFYFCSLEPRKNPYSTVDMDILQLMALWVGYELDRKLAEQQVREHQTQLAHVARLSTMGEMATGLAHELNQPLAAIVNYAQGCVRRIQSGNAESQMILDALNHVSDQATRAGGIIRRLREFVKKRAPLREVCDINDVVQSCVNFVDLEARKAQVTIRLKLAEGVAKVSIDKIEVEQVLMNLLLNAIEAMNMPNWNTRELSIQTMNTPASEVMVVVSDSGPGVSAEVLEQVFDAFYTTKPSGMGMGLSISRSLIEAHKGRLWVTSEPGKGAVFRFSLPAHDGAEHGGH